ncbi:MAG: InlB B-repeat-containing protein, partial [Lachnospiraceae bacterium]|nr:InlB B-repeat-containing protein [Lachnospiraceae bacterium]
MQTDIGNDTETYGYWYVATDKPEGGNSTVIWDYTVPGENTPIIDSNIADYGGLSGTAVLDKGNSNSDADPYVMICFDVVGQTSNTDPTPAPGDASTWGGLSIAYACDCQPSLDLGLGEVVDATIEYANPSASLPKTTGSGAKKTLAWTDFKQPSWYKGATKISGTDAATELVSVRFRIQAPAGTYHFKIDAVGPYDGTVPAGVTLPPTTYNIIYNLNGGTNAADNPATFTGVTKTFTLADPSRDGYAFAGWFSDLKLTKPASPTISQGTRCSKIFYAKWKRSLANSDITIETIPAQSYTGSAIEPAVVVKDGENDITDQCEFEYTDNTDAGTATVTITAKADNEQYGGRATTTFQINKVDLPAGT